MLEITKTNDSFTATVEIAKLRTKTEWYLTELLTQRLADAFMAKYGDELISKITHDELILTTKKLILDRLNEDIEHQLRNN